MEEEPTPERPPIRRATRADCERIEELRPIALTLAVMFVLATLLLLACGPGMS